MARKVIDEHPCHHVILLTHAYQTKDDGSPMTVRDVEWVRPEPVAAGR